GGGSGGAGLEGESVPRLQRESRVRRRGNVRRGAHAVGERGVQAVLVEATLWHEEDSTMILVTGATGTNGRLVVQALLAAGARVRAMVQDSSRAADLARAGAELAVADFDRAETLDRALAGAERSLLLSAVDQRLVDRETRFVERAKQADLKHGVKVSAIGADPAASFTFGRQHGAAERIIMDSGLSFTFVQPNFFMQNLLWSAGTIKAQGELLSTLGSTPASHVDARDIAAVIATVLTDPLNRHDRSILLVTWPARLSFDPVPADPSMCPGRQ